MILLENPNIELKRNLLLAALGAVMIINPLAAAPLKVYLMAGQSNMQGFCGDHTFPQIYRMMMEHAQSVLGDIRKVYPAYDASQGYELKGFHACYHYLGSAKIMSRRRSLAHQDRSLVYRCEN